MSASMQQIIRTLRNAYTAFNCGDMDAAVSALDPEIEWTEPAEFPGGGAYHGRDEVKRYLEQSREAWAEIIGEPEQFIVAGDKLVIFVRARLRPKGSSSWQDAKIADVYTIHNQRPIQMSAFADRQDALRWAGVEDVSPDELPLRLL